MDDIDNVHRLRLPVDEASVFLNGMDSNNLACSTDQSSCTIGDPPPLKRKPFSFEHEWNGTQETWGAFRNLFCSWWASQQMSYFMNPKFQEAYITYKGDWLQVKPHSPAYLTKSQMQIDSAVVYFGLLSALYKNGVKSEYFLYQYPDDGFASWYALEKVYGELHLWSIVDSVKSKLREHYSSSLHGTLYEFINRQASLYAKLDQLHRDYPKKVSLIVDDEKMYNVVTHLDSFDCDKLIDTYMHCSDNQLSFQHFIEKVTSYVNVVHYGKYTSLKVNGEGADVRSLVAQVNERYSSDLHGTLYDFIHHQASLYAKLDLLHHKYPQKVSLIADADKMHNLVTRLHLKACAGLYHTYEHCLENQLSFQQFIVKAISYVQFVYRIR